MQLFQDLNEQQREAVETLQGPLLVLAGAGSGKTRVVTYRIVNLLEQGVPASKILGLTFTNKAAGEMRERVRGLTSSDVLICTFHSLGARILRESIGALGYTRDFTIYDDEDVDKVIKEGVAGVCKGDAKLEKEVRGLISKAKNGLQGSDEIEKSRPTTPGEQIFPEVYRYYQEKLKAYNALDFDDLLYLPVKLFPGAPEILGPITRTAGPHLLIDEYQDTNRGAIRYGAALLVQGGAGTFASSAIPTSRSTRGGGANIQKYLKLRRGLSGSEGRAAGAELPQPLQYPGGSERGHPEKTRAATRRSSGAGAERERRSVFSLRTMSGRRRTSWPQGFCSTRNISRCP